MYNLDVGEHYYTPMTNYLEAERGTRGETPGALTFDERLSRNWLHGRRYEATEARDRYARCSSLAKDSGSTGFMPSALRSARAASEVATAATASQAQASASSSRQQMVAASMSASRQQASSQQTSVKSTREEQTSILKKQSMASTASKKEETSVSASKTTSAAAKSSSASASASASKFVSSRRIDDDVSKKIADIHITPFSKGQELDAANAASARARARIMELERELEEITKKAMTTQVRALKTAKQMAAEAMAQDEANMSSSVKRTKKVMIESSAKIN